MPSTPPPGDPAPSDGRLPESALATLGDRPFGVYVHVPYCARRCGYCDFNTYVDTDGSALSYIDAVRSELDLAVEVLGTAPAATTVFLGGGTPTLLPASHVAQIVAMVEQRFGLTPDAEVSVEANPESIDERYLHALADAGVNRLSLGLQHMSPHVLATLDREHTPGRALDCLRWARAAGIERTSVDLIYGVPGESATNWGDTLAAVIHAGPEHVSAYALTVEPGTALHAAVHRGDTDDVDPDVQAERYEAADDTFNANGYAWYEISNWARTAGARCRHNLGYWRGDDWWGVGPGAHSHIGGVRWWNVRLPAEHATAVASGKSPAQAREVLDVSTRAAEQLMLGIRLAEGLPRDETDPDRALRLLTDGLLQPEAYDRGRLVLTQRGRLLADTVVRTLAA